MKEESRPEAVPSTATVGPLDRHLPVFVRRMTQQGYCATSLKPKIVVVNRFNRCLASRSLVLPDLNEQTVIASFKESPRPGRVRRGDHSQITHKLAFSFGDVIAQCYSNMMVMPGAKIADKEQQASRPADNELAGAITIFNICKTGSTFVRLPWP